jgi:hypothetical protein
MVTTSMGVTELTVWVPSTVKVDGCQKGQHKQSVVALEKQLYKVLTEMNDCYSHISKCILKNQKIQSLQNLCI